MATGRLPCGRVEGDGVGEAAAVGEGELSTAVGVAADEGVVRLDCGAWAHETGAMSRPPARPRTNHARSALRIWL